MASSVVEEITAELVETAVEESVQCSVEEFVEQSVEEAVEADVSQVVEEDVQSATETAVQETVESAVEEEAERAVEINVEQVISEAGESYWKNAFKDNILPSIIAGLVVDGIIEGIKKITEGDKDKEDSGEGSAVDKGIQERQRAASNVLQKVQETSKRWQEKVEEFQKSGVENPFGKFEYKKEQVDGGIVMAILIHKMNKELEDAKNVAVKSMQEKSWNANITEFQWHVINSCEYMTAVFNLKGLDCKMKEIEFPPDSDKVELAEVLKTEFPDYKSIIKQMAKEHLENAVTGLVLASASNAVKALIRQPLKEEIQKGFDAKVRPEVVEEARKAAKAQTTVVFNRWQPKINKHLAIPVYGLATLKSWMQMNIMPEAVEEAKTKAQEAAKATMELPPSQLALQGVTEDAKKEVLQKYKVDIDKAVKESAREYINQALHPHGEVRAQGVKCAGPVKEPCLIL